MQKVKTFVHVFINSLIPRIAYYPKILRTKFVFSLQYYIFLLLVLNFIFLAFLPFKYNVSKLPALLDAIIASLEQFPTDLKITISNGFLITSYNRPYFMWLEDNNRKTLFLAIDENSSLQNTNLKPLVLLTGQSLVVNTGGYPMTLPLSNLKVKTMDKQKIDTFVNTLAILQRLLPVFVLSLFLLLLIIIPLGSIIINTFYILIASFIVYGIFRLFFKHKLHFKKTLQIAFHAVTLPLIVDYFLIIIKPTVYVNSINVPQFAVSMPFLFLILLSIFIFGGIYEAHLHHLKARK